MSDSLFGFDVSKQWDYENGFYITSPITRIAKMVAHYELYKKIIHLPGQIIECGVYKGASIIRFATYREILESSYSRKIIGFDAFGKFPEATNRVDQEFIANFVAAGGNGISINELKDVFTHKNIINYELISGDILITVPRYVANHPELKIAMLHVDVDVYTPTVTILDSLFDKVVKGGLIIFDDYATVEGETRAIDEFFLKKNVTIEKLSISHIPSYIRK